MDVGTIGFHDRRAVTKRLAEKNKVAINRLTKTKEERDVNYEEAHKLRDRKERKKHKKIKKKKMKEEQQKIKESKAQKELENYTGVFDDVVMTSNKDNRMTAEQYEDNFM